MDTLYFCIALAVLYFIGSIIICSFGKSAKEADEELQREYLDSLQGKE